MESHRAEVRDAILDAAAALAFDHGVTAVTMSGVAVGAGIGRATLYKYFGGVEEILMAWHERQVGRHLALLAEAADGRGDAGERLRRVLETFAVNAHGHHGTDLAALVHRGEHVDHAHRQLEVFIEELVVEAASSGTVRDDGPATELAAYCINALGAASSATSKAAVRRLVTVTLDGLRPPA